jgi:hypothetical protein
MDIVQLIYRPDEPQGSLKDFESSRPTMQLRWQQGLADARTTLQASPWLAPMTSELGVRVFDVMHGLLTRNEAIAGQQPTAEVPRRCNDRKVILAISAHTCIVLHNGAGVEPDRTAPIHAPYKPDQ